MQEIKIGGESYVGKSNYTVTEAKRNVAYETLMRTRYAFSDIPEELKMFKPKSNFHFCSDYHADLKSIICHGTALPHLCAPVVLLRPSGLSYAHP